MAVILVLNPLGTMKEVADMVVFLASDRANYVNGARIAVDRGYTINAR